MRGIGARRGFSRVVGSWSGRSLEYGESFVIRFLIYVIFILEFSKGLVVLFLVSFDVVFSEG